MLEGLLSYHISRVKQKTKIALRAKQLENIDSKNALAWVQAQNECTLNQFTQAKDFSDIFKETHLERRSWRFVNYQIHHHFLYSLWQDDVFVQGVWRRITLQDYREGKETWEFLFDLNHLQDEAWFELLDAHRYSDMPKEHWYFIEAIFAPNGKSVLIGLSLGGRDACVYREFDLQTKRFLQHGFNLHEDKVSITWFDDHALLMSKKMMIGQRSQRQIIYLSRNAKAKCILADNIVENNIYVKTQFIANKTYHFITRPMPNGNEFYLLHANLEVQALALPSYVTIHGVYQHFIILSLDEDWLYQDYTYKTDSIIAINLYELIKNNNIKIDIVFAPMDKKYFRDVLILNDSVMISVLNNVKEEIYRYRFDQGKWHQVKMPFPEEGTLNFIGFDEKNDDCLIQYEDFLTPKTIYYYDTQANTLQITQKAKMQFESCNFMTQQYFARSKDGTLIPYFLIHPKNMVLNGQNPTILTGYGGYKIPLQPFYLGAYGQHWLNENGVYVVANIRGGGEFGTSWYTAALREKRLKSFEDFIAVAEDLIAKKITSKKYLGISGQSNGGLLVATVTMMRPDLFNAVFCGAAHLDMLKFTAYPGASWMSVEYGEPNDPFTQKILKSYSPYHNIHSYVQYPKILFTACRTDDRVHPGHTRKMVDKMQTLGHAVFYFESEEGGHVALNDAQAAFHTALMISYFRKQLMQPSLCNDFLMNKTTHTTPLNI